jgi:ABC-2 type transport system permease protein
VSAPGLRERIAASAFWPMLWKEFVQMRRDRITLAMMVVLPAMQLILFGFAIRTEVRHLPLVVLDESQSRASRELVAALENGGTFTVVGDVADRERAKAAIGSGRASAALVVPPDYAPSIERRRTATAQVIVDAADPQASASALSGAVLAGAALSNEITRARGAGGPPPLDLRVLPLYNPALRSEVFIVPGIVGVLLSLTMIVISSLAVVRERERGTLEQLIVTPIDKTSLMLGKLLPFVLVGYVQMSVVLTLGKLLFDVPIRGSLSLLYLVTFGFIAASLGIGLLISTVVRSQTQAMQLGLFAMLPNILLSGFMFPRAAMPAPIRALSAALPLTYYLEVLRGILLKNVGIAELWPQSLALLGFATVLLALSIWRFSRTVE